MFNKKYQNKTINLAAFSNKPKFILSFNNNLDTILKSIKKFGQIMPILAFASEKENKLVIIDGFQRYQALKKLGFSEALIQLIPKEKFNILQIALTANQHRQFNLAEKVIISNYFTESKLFNLTEFGALINEGLNEKKLKTLQKIALWPTKYLKYLSIGKLDLKILEKLNSYPEPEKFALTDLFIDFALSLQKRKQVLEIIEDIGRRENLTLTAILNGSEIQSSYKNLEFTDRPQAGEILRQALWERRNPYLSNLHHERNLILKSLKFAPKIDLKVDPDFETKEIELKLKFSELKDFKQQLESLKQLLENQKLADLLNKF